MFNLYYLYTTTGIELKYHEQNAKTGLDVDSFLMPYNHFDVLIEGKGIKLFPIPENREKDSASLESKYRQYLELNGLQKPDSVISHDMKLLDTVHSLRSKSANSLDAGALLVTCDYILYKFELEKSRQENRMSCVVLPNIFWQILRPFIPQDIDFDRAFAETFAIPEFRTIGSGAAQACSKLIAVLASYKELPEETLIKVLSNKLLIDQLRTIENSKEFQEYVESSIVAENASLFNEKISLLNEKISLQTQLEQAKIDYILEKDEREKNEDKIKTLENELLYIHNGSNKQKRYSSLVISILAILLFEFSFRKLKLDWLISHPMTYLWQIAISILLISVISGLFNKWEKWTKDTTALGLVMLFIGFLLSPKNIVIIITLCILACILLHYTVRRIPWNWLLRHPQTFTLQGAFHGVLISLILGIFYNKTWFALLFVPICKLIIDKLGGKQTNSRNISA